MKVEFADQSRKVLALAVEAAHRLKHDYVGPEHMLLGILRVAAGLELVERCGGDGEAVRGALLDMLRPGTSKRRGGPLPYTSRAKKTLELAMAAARESGASSIDLEHLLAGLIAEERGPAAQVLERFGIGLDAASGTAAARAGGAVIALEIDDASDRSIYEQIVAQIRESVAMGALVPGQRLPPVRRLADQLDIAPGTVARAYSELERLGVVVTQGARGTHVAEREPSSMPAAARPDTLAGLLRPVAVAAFHLGANAEDLRSALETAMRDIFNGGNR